MQTTLFLSDHTETEWFTYWHWRPTRNQSYLLVCREMVSTWRTGIPLQLSCSRWDHGCQHFFLFFFFFTPAILLVIILGCVLPYLNEKIINTLNNPLTVQVFQLTLCTCFKMQAKVREGKIKRYVGGSFVFLGWQAAINYF